MVKDLSTELTKFLVNASSRFQMSRDTIREVLRDKFEGFDPIHIPEYESYLHLVRTQRELPVPALGRKIVYVDNETCPICGEKIINDDSLRGKYTKTPGFRCSSGDPSHYWKARTNMIMKAKGKPLIFPEISKESNVGPI